MEHMHGVNAGRAESRTVRHNLLVESSRRPEAAPSALLNEFVTPDTALGLSSEPALKQAIQRRRRIVRPKDPDTSAGIQITGEWSETLDGKLWYLGEVVVGNDSGYIFATEDNLLHLNLSTFRIFYCITCENFSLF